IVFDAEQPRHGDPREHVLDVEASAQARPQLDSPGTEPRTVFVELEVLGSDVGIVDEAERQQRLVAQRTQLASEPTAVLVADVDGRRRTLALDEEAALRLVVVLESAV